MYNTFISCHNTWVYIASQVSSDSWNQDIQKRKKVLIHRWTQKLQGHENIESQPTILDVIYVSGKDRCRDSTTNLLKWKYM